MRKSVIDMITAGDISRYIDSFAPVSSQCEWDNSGLLVGNGERPVGKIAFALDITADVVEAAKENGADMIVSHHPVIFRPFSSLDESSPVYLAARYSIVLYSCHTPLDKAKCGVNDVLCDALGLSGVTSFAEEGDEAMLRSGNCREMSPEDFAEYVSEKLGAPVRAVLGKKNIKNVSVCGGAGGDFISFVSEKGSDAFVTGELRHHEMLLAKEAGITAIEAGHYQTENPVIPVLAGKISEKFGVETVIIHTASPFVTVRGNKEN